MRFHRGVHEPEAFDRLAGFQTLSGNGGLAATPTALRSAPERFLIPSNPIPLAMTLAFAPQTPNRKASPSGLQPQGWLSYPASASITK